MKLLNKNFRDFFGEMTDFQQFPKDFLSIDIGFWVGNLRKRLLRR